MAKGRATKRSKTPEGMVLRGILDFLLVKRILAFRMNTGCIPSTYGGKTRMIKFGATGMADVLAFPLINGRPIPWWIEAKADSKQTAAQISFQKIVEDNGHLYTVAHSSEDVAAKLRELEKRL